ncbi:hypothetical protein GCM10010404_35230 [Nonomuraea africana]
MHMYGVPVSEDGRGAEHLRLSVDMSTPVEVGDVRVVTRRRLDPYLARYPVAHWLGAGPVKSRSSRSETFERIVARAFSRSCSPTMPDRRIRRATRLWLPR